MLPDCGGLCMPRVMVEELATKLDMIGFEKRALPLAEDDFAPKWKYLKRAASREITEIPYNNMPLAL